MSLLRTTFVRNAPRTLTRSPALSLGGRRFASQDYGSGAGDPKGENPQQQGANPSADKEHPGPPPPKAGQGSGSATKGTSTGQNTDAAKTGAGSSHQQKKSFSTMARRLAGQDYGSGEGDPKGENPQQQGANPSADKEHPGPPPPKAGQGSGGATKGTSTGHNTGNAQQKKSFSTVARRLSDEHPKSTKGLEPKLNKNTEQPAEKDLPEDVKKHNREMAERADQANEKLEDDTSKKGDKVDKKFWAGHGGADRDP